MRPTASGYSRACRRPANRHARRRRTAQSSHPGAGACEGIEEWLGRHGASFETAALRLPQSLPRRRPGMRQFLNAIDNVRHGEERRRRVSNHAWPSCRTRLSFRDQFLHTFAGWDPLLQWIPAFANMTRESGAGRIGHHPHLCEAIIGRIALMLRRIQMLPLTQIVLPGLCRASTNTGKTCTASRGWPGQARPRRLSESCVCV